MSLKELIPALCHHISTTHRGQLIYQTKLLEIFEGSIEKYVIESLRKEMPKSYKQMQEAIIPINIIPRIINKLSGVYNCSPTRMTTENQFDQANVDTLSFSVDQAMILANQYVNLFRHCALEPYLENGKPKIRVIPPTSFTVYTDDQSNPTSPKVFVKFIGYACSMEGQRTTNMGVSNSQPENMVNRIETYEIWSNDEFLIIDAKGNIRPELMGESDGVNPFGVIPFVYLNLSKNLLIPLPNSDMFKIGVQIPKMITCLANSIKFNLNPLTYTLDLDFPKEVDRSPGVVLNLKSDPSADPTSQKQGKIDILKPDLNITETIAFIHDTLTLWFESIGIKAPKTGDSSATLSGVAKAIDDIDVTEFQKQQKPLLLECEDELWKLMVPMFQVWSSAGLLDQEIKPFSSEFFVTTSIEDKGLANVSDKEAMDALVLKVTNKLISHRRAVKQANPDLSDEEVDEMIKEIQLESAANAPVVQVISPPTTLVQE